MFHRSILSQSHWNACEEKNRIKVQLSGGYLIQQGGEPHFVKLVDHAMFSFQPAPIGMSIGPASLHVLSQGLRC